ncbi:TAF6-like RNA polymerase II p300/CBP-associated factor-associated factor 65 kDa subunit 6L [Acipenser ruthenus]|uniref:TAF6-like RNA polymerase II p300/CBP-associated factor-associated factor 65 kDa subunit 6L n=1 Tax=Acipenser ruthenus TaxID=7906 RepID=UPI00156027AF|nr:TAF6-like RNA polymerase II p300/CBP-associated factor-associated factor 65 kDa subunit 6L [Acipenser ruthenus]
MADREERKFAEVPRDSVKLMAESVGVELSDDIAAMLAEDVCYRLREAAQNSSQFMRHAKRRRLTVEDFNRALRWSNVEAVCGYGSQDALPFRPLKEGELYFVEDREINLVELALATNIPKGCAETMVRVQVSYLDGKGNVEPQGAVPTAVQSLTDDLLKYYQQVTRAILGEDQQLMKVALQDLQTNSKIAALLPYFVHVVSGVKSVSHDLEQLSRLLHMVKSLVQNPFLYLGSYIKSLVSSVMYCILEPLAASINPLNDHWTLRDYAALLLSHIFWAHGDLVGGLYHQILLSLQKVLSDPVRPLCSHYGAVVGLHALGWKAVERVLFPHLSAYWSNLQAVLDDDSVSNAQVKADGHKVYGAILVAVEKLLKMKAQSRSVPAEGSVAVRERSFPGLSPPQEPVSEPGFGIASHLLQGAAGVPAEEPVPVPLPVMYRELYAFFGDSLAVRFSTGPGIEPRASRAAPHQPPDSKKEGMGPDTTRKMPQLTASMTISPRQDSSPKNEPSLPAVQNSSAAPSRFQRSSSSSLQRSKPPPSKAAQRSAGPPREVFQKSRFPLPPATAPFSFLIAGRQTGRRCQGRRFQTSFPQLHPPNPSAQPPRGYAHKLPVIGRMGKPIKRWVCSQYSLHLPL